MSLNPETLREIDGLVRGGFEERARIIEILCEEMYAPGELDEADVIAAVDATFTALAQDKTTWPATTDCDRLDGVYQFESAAGGQLVFVYLPLDLRQTLATGGSIRAASTSHQQG